MVLGDGESTPTRRSGSALRSDPTRSSSSQRPRNLEPVTAITGLGSQASKASPTAVTDASPRSTRPSSRGASKRRQSSKGPPDAVLETGNARRTASASGRRPEQDDHSNPTPRSSGLAGGRSVESGQYAGGAVPVASGGFSSVDNGGRGLGRGGRGRGRGQSQQPQAQGVDPVDCSESANPHCTISMGTDASAEIRTKVFRIGAPLLRSTIPVSLGRNGYGSGYGAMQQPPVAAATAAEQKKTHGSNSDSDDEVETVLSISDAEVEDPGQLSVTLDFPC